MKAPRRVLICMYWGMQLVPSIQVPCGTCGQFLAMDAENRGLGIEPMCPGCLVEETRKDDVAIAGSAGAGRLIDEKPVKVPQEVIEWARRTAARHKRALAIMGN